MLNAILATLDAFFASWTTKLSSQRPQRKTGRGIRGFVDLRTPAGDASRQLKSRRVFMPA